MKKQFSTVVLLTLLITAATAQEKFVIKGKLTGLAADGKVMLTYMENETRKQDSAITKNGAFTISGSVGMPVKASIELKSLQPDNTPMDYEKYMNRDATEFFLEKGAVTITGPSLKKAEIKGGKAQQDYLQFQAQLKPLQDKMSPLSEKMRQYSKEKNEEASKQLFPQLRAIRQDMTKAENDYIASHPDSYVTLDLVQAKSTVIDVPTFEPVYNSMSATLKNSPVGKKLGKKLELARKTGIGQPALAFTQNNTEGTPVSLASLKGKYVLIDFWASWCGPCRAENPNVVKAYNQFRDKNFEIIAVSLDDKKDPWLEAIKKDGLPWIHVSDLKGWKNEVAQNYGINAVPQNLLLDPNGVIIAKNMRGEDLSKKLAELIK